MMGVARDLSSQGYQLPVFAQWMLDSAQMVEDTVNGIIDDAYTSVDDAIDFINDMCMDIKSVTDAVVMDIKAQIYDFYLQASSAMVAVDPLVIDLDNDGIDLLSVEEGVYFDEDHRGLRERTQWVGNREALLAIDLDGDGEISNGSELFGNSTLLADGTRAERGLEALAQWDENEDGIIDSSDTVFSSLLVWQDANTDGISQETELKTLTELGITGITLGEGEGEAWQESVTGTDTVPESMKWISWRITMTPWKKRKRGKG